MSLCYNVPPLCSFHMKVEKDVKEQEKNNRMIESYIFYDNY